MKAIAWAIFHGVLSIPNSLGKLPRKMFREIVSREKVSRKKSMNNFWKRIKHAPLFFFR
jgi:hypothetical protein